MPLNSKDLLIIPNSHFANIYISIIYPFSLKTYMILNTLDYACYPLTFCSFYLQTKLSIITQFQVLEPSIIK